MERQYYLGFSAFSGIGPVRLVKLLHRFGSAEKAWNAEEAALGTVLGEALGKKLVDFRKSYDVEKYEKTLKGKNIEYLTWKSNEYPTLLKPFVPDTISNQSILHSDIAYLSPFVLYCKGDLSVLQHARAIGIVGTRNITDYGREVTKKLTQELVHGGFAVVSGLAFGVDGVAHATTLQEKGKTIAVLGGGVDICTPAEHQRLYEDIIANGGCIVSSVVPGERPIKGSFPARNMIIAGLSQGVVVTEGAEDSGALYTAKDALRLQRPVFAVPGPITSSLSQGPNNLLRQGAVVVRSAYDIMESLSTVIPKSDFIRVVHDNKKKGDSKEENKILNLLSTGPLHFDDIVRKMGKDSSEVGSLLSLMELKGFIKTNSDGTYRIN